MLFVHLASLQTYTGEFATIKYYLWRIYSDKSKHLFKLQLEESYKHQDLFSFSGFSILNQLLQELILLVISLTWQKFYSFSPRLHFYLIHPICLKTLCLPVNISASNSAAVQTDIIIGSLVLHFTATFVHLSLCFWRPSP